jgi:hypothetical protein
MVREGAKGVKEVKEVKEVSPRALSPRKGERGKAQLVSAAGYRDMQVSCAEPPG